MMHPFDINETPITGLNLIEASAGTGKTYTIETVYIRLLLERDLPVESILVVTFTEAATSELRDRIRDRIRAVQQAFSTGRADDDFVEQLLARHADRPRSLKRLKMALAQFDEAAIFTIHGFCRKMLMDFAFESQSRFDTELVKDQRELIAEIGMDYWRNRLYTGSENLVEYMMGVFRHPEEFSRNLQRILSKPVKRVLTGLESEDTDGLIGSAQRLFDDLAVDWEGARDELENILLNHRGLKHNPYNKKNVPPWMAQMDRYFQRRNPFVPPDCLKKFYAGAIASYASGKADSPEHSVFFLCEELGRVLHGIDVSLRKEFLDFAVENLEVKKHSLNVRSFDDLLKNLHASLYGPGGSELAARIGRKYSVALIDEFQDTDPVQYEIFKRIFADSDPQLFYIGDPKQSIYNFRGADIFAYMDAQRDAEHRYTLDVNWRSDGDLVSAVNRIFESVPSPFVFEEIPFLPTHGAPVNPPRSLLIDDELQVPFQIWYIEKNGGQIGKTEGRQKTARAVAGEITELLNRGADKTAALVKSDREEKEYLIPGHMAVLVRTHIEAELVQQALKRHAVPSVINTKENIFDSHEFREVKTVLLAIVNHGMDVRIKNALATDMMGVVGDRLSELTDDEKKWDGVFEKFHHYHELWNERGYYSMIRRFMHREGVRSRLLKLPDGERRLTNLLQVLELFHEAESGNRLGMSGLMKWSDGIRTSADVQEENQIRLETDEEAVQILTIHASKGLEFPIVFCPFAWGSSQVGEVFFHDDDNDGQLSLDLGSPDREKNRRKAEREALAETIRLLYVALTRAKHRCYLVWGNINQTEDTAMSYLFHAGHPEERDVRNDLRELAEGSRGTIQLSDLPDFAERKYVPGTKERRELDCPTFKGDLSMDWSISSFSSLSARHVSDVEAPDRDRVESYPIRREEPDSLPESRPEELNMFTLPGGAKTGNCFHEMFEYLDFQENDPETIGELIGETLKKYDFEPKWEVVASRTVQNTLSVPLSFEQRNDGSFSLSQISMQDRISEMEFYFSLRKITTRGLEDVIRDHVKQGKGEALLKTVKRLDLKTIGGFMKGYVDLIFRHDGRFYIVDWKTNNLGDAIEDYDPSRLKEYMVDHSFILQYYIYSIALHKMLKLRIKDYRFDTHFGGVFYFFIRGVDASKGVDYGVYRDALAGCGNLIEGLERYLCGG
ncbi:MAG: exodeoxyribonuclease V subunit beta [Proteobacteria bacterium]|nr:exodeoxyribonuclease V subunit beta [Pseudomonadota bacterium]